MIEAGQFIGSARARGFVLWSGVPCSYLTSFINGVIAEPSLQYVPANNEGEAVAIAAGAQIGGHRSIAMMQNSGLGNAVSPLTSLVHVHRTPILLIVSLRGDPAAPADEPQHSLMGPITGQLLDLMQIRWSYFPEDPREVDDCLDRAIEHMDDSGLAYCLVMRKGAVAAGVAATALPVRPLGHAVRGAHRQQARWKRQDFLASLQAAAGEQDILVSTTGYTSRELYALADRPNQLYVVGAMGCASSVGLGLALSRPDVRITVLDGDGAALMRMGAMAAIGYQRPSNLLHIVLDNGVHESTGGQATVTPSLDLAAVAAACGYPETHHVSEPAQLAAIFAGARQQLTFANAAVVPGVRSDLPRPKVLPPEATARVSAYLSRLERSR